ncbi:hypothetical protein DZF91_15260 [Actinomadura logoneensis]|uniref:Uncharacterized protein n=1 Tax=Actinomadura logoneensis TaxID=2293572 RepID=A0A372JLC7_9ACTN|nr:hypothetical protein [Actinomadura logoneensis]RFU40795.1 hypothetical protein DZF91_15260 [Actinomadura logoneensis]
MRALRSPAAVILYVLALAFAVWPLTIGYTVLAGEKAEARVLSCHRSHSGRTLTTTCTGTWTKADGASGEGEIYNVDEDDYGRGITVRFGPFGPYAHGWGRNIPFTSAGFGLGTVACLAILALLVHARRKKDTATAWRASQAS